MMNTILLLIIGANILFSYKGFTNLYFFRKYDFHIGSIKAGEQIRMFSSAFLHADWMHLIFNMYTLYMFANVVTSFLGSSSFLLIYIGSLLFGNLLTLYFHNRDNNYRAIGASGAVTGVLYAAILLQPNMGIYLFFIPIAIPAYIFGIVYLLYSIYGMKSQNDNIGHTAHFGGAVGGYAITLLKMPQLFAENPSMVMLLAIPIVVLFGMAKAGKI